MSDNPFNTANEYWAAKPADAIGSELKARTRFTTAQFLRNPLFGIARKAYRFFYTINDRGQDAFGLNRAGEQGELTVLQISHFQSLIRSTVNLVSQSRPSLLPVAVNSDYKSQSQTKVASGVLDYYVRRELEQKWLDQTTQALIMGAAYLKIMWETDAGEQDPLTGMKAGDLRFTVLSPFDVSFDDGAQNDDHEWMITREYQNKYDLAAKFPVWGEEILKIGMNADERVFNPFLRVFTQAGTFNTDQIPVFEFFHKKTSALPDGRYVLYLTPDIILYDGPLPVKNIPVVKITAGKIYSTPWAFSPFWGLLGMQEAMNVVSSQIMTNLATFGGATLVYEKTAELNPKNLGAGIQGIPVISMDKAPKVLEMTPSSQPAYQALNMIKDQMQLISGINDVARGVPPPNLSSGTALALVQSQAYLNNSDFEKQYVNLLEKTGELMFELLKNYATNSRTISVLNGKSNQFMLKEFKGADIADVDRVQVQVTNPLLRTPAGKAEYASQIVKIDNPKDRAVFINIMETGRDDTLTEPLVRKLLNIRKENELLMDGQVAIALKLDNHADHIQEHLGLLEDPDIRMNPELTQAVMDHIEQHYQYWQSMTPGELAVVGLQPLPPDQAPMPPAGPGGPPMPPPPDGGGSSDAAVAQAARAGQEVMSPQTTFEDAKSVQAAKLPNNPATGQPWNPQNGGLT